MPNNKDQASRFKEAARQLDYDDNEARFDATLKKIATAPKPKEGGMPDGKES